MHYGHMMQLYNGPSKSNNPQYIQPSPYVHQPQQTSFMQQISFTQNTQQNPFMQYPQQIPQMQMQQPQQMETQQARQPPFMHQTQFPNQVGHNQPYININQPGFQANVAQFGSTPTQFYGQMFPVNSNPPGSASKQNNNPDKGQFKPPQQ